MTNSCEAIVDNKLLLAVKESNSFTAATYASVYAM